MAIANRKSLLLWVLFFSCLYILVIKVKQIYHYRHLDPNMMPENYSFLKVRFSKTSLKYPYGYFCRHSLVKVGEEINSNRISQININNSPPSFILDNKEILYVDYSSKEKLEEFARLNNIDIIDRPEIWEMLCEPFIEEDNEEKHKKTLEELVKNGLMEDEIIRIRKKIKWNVLYKSTLDWWGVGVDHFDYLDKRLFLTKTKYWWTMEILLRYNNKTK